MAHNINYNEQTGKHSFFSVKEKAWHNLGQVVQDYPTSAEAIMHAGLNYGVEKRPLFTMSQEIISEGLHSIGNIRVPDYYSTVRNDNDCVLGVVGKDYHIVQNRDAFSFFDSIVGGDGILYETAGALGKGYGK
ncbi:DUF932 domain-containing protein [Flavobacterium psychroterrae]|uniref:DUF932 domain-containing protein n=1 Tax=Flavobacterium psychroterrae TaxID=2133767 RepID=A0ABS5PIV4_9FLAO|nr:DUF932 domain-containing protein [Flavobacterium psychroterrae]